MAITRWMQPSGGGGQSGGEEPAFQLGDVLAGAQFDLGWNGFTDGGGGSPGPAGKLDIDTAVGINGHASVRRTVSRSGWQLVSCTNASPPVVVLSPAPSFSTGTQVGISSTLSATLNSTYDTANRFVKQLAADTYEIYTDAGCTTPAAAPGAGIVQTSSVVGRGDETAAFHYPFYSKDGFNSGQPKIWVHNNVGVARAYSSFKFLLDADFDVGSGTLKPIVKFQVNQKAGFNKFGDYSIFVGNLVFLYDWEWGGGYISLGAISSFNDGRWHSIETDQQYAGNTDDGGNDYMSTAIWVDSIARDQTNTGNCQGGTVAGLNPWVNGRCNARSRDVSNPTTPDLIGVWGGLNVVNANNQVPGHVWMTDIRVSTLGRVGV